MRLDKFLAHNGFGTRKEVKELVKRKIVVVNGEVAKSASIILNLEEDIIHVEGELITYQENVYYMMNKPSGYICSHESDLYPSVLELIHDFRKDLIMVGRLDVDTEGLLLITSDGKFSHTIAHSKKVVYKQYEVILDKPFDARFISMLQEGMMMDDDVLKSATVIQLDSNRILLSIAEGKYHQVKRMMHACNNEVVYLRRVKIGNLMLDEALDLGMYRPLTDTELSFFI